MDRNKVIGERIGQARESANETQQNLADALGVKREMVTYWENGKRPIKAETLFQIAKRYSVSGDYLLGLSENRTVSEDMKTVIKVTGLPQTAIEKIIYWQIDDDRFIPLEELLSSDLFYDFLYDVGRATGNAVAIPRQLDRYKEDFANDPNEELGTLERFLKELRYSVFVVSESATDLVSELGGIKELKDKLNSRIDELMKEWYRGGE